MPELDKSNWNDSSALGLPQGEGGQYKLQKSTEGDDPLSEPSLKRFFAAVKSTANDHRLPREMIWKEAWCLYNNEYDWSDKAWWQHKTPIPKVRASVDRAVGIFRKTLLKVQPFYGIQAESKLGRTKGRYTMLLTDYWLDQAAAIEEIVTAFRVGLITSTSILKIFWMRVRDTQVGLETKVIDEPVYEFGVHVGQRSREEKTAKLKETYKGKLGIMAVNPQNFWIVPGTRGRSVIERDECSLNELEALVKDAAHPDGIYEAEAIARLRNKLSGPVKSQDDSWQTHESRYNANDYFRNINLFHYWGDIYDNAGKLVMADGSFTLADEDILIRKARPNPFFHNDHPYTVGSPYMVPFSTYNRGMVEDVSEIAKSITQLACLIADGGLYDAMKAFSIDVDQLEDPADARNGVYPGKTFIRKSSQGTGAPNEQLVQTVDVGKVPQEAMNTVAMFERYFQEGSFVNEWVGGTGTAKGSTLGEVNIKTQASLEGLDESARNLEVTLLEPALTKSTKVIYQYNENYMLERLVDNYPQLSMLLQGMQPAERYATMVGDYSFKVRGMSVMIDRAQRIGELKEILTLLSYLPGFVEQLNPIATLEEILMPMGWDPQRLLINPGQGSVTTPAGGPGMSMPTPPGMPAPGGTPMQARNASEGARLGGAVNNPSGGPAGNANAVRGGGQPFQLNPQMLMQLMQQMRGGR
jgi:hypothetical protein